ncbi:hypothetical protein JL720_8531 [Aureococcus anophagefferens]|nr:hypothetical protein JL720_8531 [Aureococcus anophagefferens]
MSKRTRASAGSYETVVEALNFFQGQLLCSRAKVSSTGQGRYAPDAIGIEADTWKKHWSAVKQDPRFTRVGMGTMDSDGLFKGGTWFYWGNAPDNLLYTGEHAAHADWVDVAAMLMASGPPPAPNTRRAEAYGKRHNKGVVTAPMEPVDTAPAEPVEDSSSDEEEDPEVAAAMAPKTPKTRARYTAPPLAEQLPLTAALLGRNKRLRTATPDLKKRTHKDDEMTTRLLATDECIRTNNKVDTGDPDQAASMLHTLASHYDCHLQLMQLGGKGKYLTARDLMSYRFKLKLRMERLMPSPCGR